MASVAIIGDGPGGLSAALFLAKNGHDATVFGLDKTAVHFADLNNYLGIPGINGSDFQEIARTQASSFGARIVEAEVTSVVRGDGGFEIQAGTDSMTSDYVILSEGRDPVIAKDLGVAIADGAVVVDTEGRTSIDRVYVVGRSARPKRSQAIISAGAGAVAALDIMASELGKDFADWDSVDDD